ncbi:hypothetical protein [Staphylococcus felis]|uniref:hypothetical protein n=1 Tax=Staphylococcus felis TaxID=46127 RepID=UPI0011591575|nr:hypothetical protein [Staphylococcus felis]
MQHLINYLNSNPIDMTGYVLAEYGKVVTNAAVNKTLGKLCDKLNTYKRTSHSLRHTLFILIISRYFYLLYIEKVRTQKYRYNTKILFSFT